MFDNDFITVFDKAVKRYKKAQITYATSSKDEEELSDYETQLAYCEEAIVRTAILEMESVLDCHDLDMADVIGDDEYINLLEEEPGRNIFQRTTEEEKLYFQQNLSNGES